MKTIGIIGGMSAHSTALYYQKLNQSINARLGGHASARCLIMSVNFAEIEACQRNNDWQGASQILVDCAKRLKLAGADCISIATNTMHCVADDIKVAVPLPLIHIADASCMVLIELGHTRALLLGTRFTMDMPFWLSHGHKHGIDVITPNNEEKDAVHRIIFDELCHGKVTDTALKTYQEVIARGKAKGATAVVLGCTEIGLLINHNNSPLPVLDTLESHVKALCDFALN